MIKKNKKIIRVGCSAGVIIGSKDLYKAELDVGDEVAIESKKNTIIIKKSNDNVS